MIKICTKCKFTKPDTNFRKWRRTCKKCESNQNLARALDYQKNNIVEYRAYQKEYMSKRRLNDPEFKKAELVIAKNWRDNNQYKIRSIKTGGPCIDCSTEKSRQWYNGQQCISCYGKQYSKTARGLALRCARQNKRRFLQKRATPKWLTQEQLNDIQDIYLNRPDGHHVDHIIPLKGSNICGLHVSWNLQYLPAKENLKKSNQVLGG